MRFIIISLLFSIHCQAQHISEFISLGGGSQTTNLVIPDQHTFQYIIEHGDDLTDGGTMADQFDFTGYVPIAGSSTNGYLSINHEQTPGGVTILDVQFDSNLKSWGYSASEDVDFSAVDYTARNCSGTITPWGTIVTSEEKIEGDINNDGYNDLGWNIEIDPVTKQVINYPGGLANGDKVWAMGNFKHENIAVHSNQRTVYQAEDAGVGHLYKFVADVAGDFSSGDLYVYVGPKTGNGTWVQLENDTPSEQNSTKQQAIDVGATIYNGGEDVEISPIDGKIYVAVKNEDVIYRYTDDSPLTGGTVSNLEVYVGDMNYTLNTVNGPEVVAWGTGNDNLAFDDLGNLWVLQDGSDNHIWVVDEGHTQTNPLVRIYARTPSGCEPTGMTFTPDFKYFFISFQHPSAGNSASVQADAFQNDVAFNKDVAIVVARREYLGNCHQNLMIDYDLNDLNNFQVSDLIQATGFLNPNADITFLAGNFVELDPGFEVALGAMFLADIESCIVESP